MMLLGILCIAFVLASQVHCDVTDISTPLGTCLRVTAGGVNARNAACGDVIGTVNTGEYYAAGGTSQRCTLSGVSYDFHSFDLGGQTAWVAGEYLEITRNANCGITGTYDPEFRAMWIATVYNIDWPTSASDPPSEQQQQMLDYLNMAQQLNFNAIVFQDWLVSTSDSPSAQQQQMLDHLNMAQQLNFNAIVFQVRPVGDAFYDSTLEPWSRYLTGTQGVAPNPYYDPLTFTCDEAHARNVEVHAWLNPYRANMSPDKDGLTADHMANRFPQYAYEYGSYLWMDPGAQVVIDHLLDVITDIVTRYDVDGIHFDDYFYPYPVDGVDFPDSATYAEYVNGGGTLALDDWRRDNVNRMIEACYFLIQTLNSNLGKNVKFSISPFGIYRPGHPEGMPSPIAGLDPYSQLYADSKLWVQQGWMDFLVPQLYWQTHPPAQSYSTLLEWWCQVAVTSGVHVYAGNGLYRLDDSWPVEEFGVQVDISRASSLRDNLSLGNCQYSAKYLLNDVDGIRSLFSELYSSPASIPQVKSEI